MTMQQTRRGSRGAEDNGAGDGVSVRLGRVLVLVVAPAVAAGALLLGVAIAVARLLG